MPTNTSGGTITSFSNTPQGMDDAFATTEDVLGVTMLDVMGRAPLLARVGTGAPEMKKRPPITWPAGMAPPGLSSVLVPLSPICPPDEANVAYEMARPIRAASPLASSPPIKVTCAGVRLL